MTMTDMDTLMEKLDRIGGCEITLNRVKQVLLSMAGGRIYIKAATIVDRHKRLQLARHMIFDQKLPRAQAVNLLMQRLNIARRTAYELIERAIATPPKVHRQE